MFIVAVLLGAAAVTLTRSPFFYARRSRSGERRTSLARTSCASRPITPKTNVFTLDAGAAEARLERDPWIAGATITKDLPSRLVIDIHERVAVAVVESDAIARVARHCLVIPLLRIIGIIRRQERLADGVWFDR